MMDKDELKPGLLIQQANILYKVSSLYDQTFTASQELPVPTRTRVHRFSYDDLFSFSPCSTQMFKRYERNYPTNPPNAA
jgi:hypothetical protein